MKILFVTRDVGRSGAPMVLLYFLRWLKTNHPDIQIDLISQKGGSLKEEFVSTCNNYTNFGTSTIEKLLSILVYRLFKKKLILFKALVWSLIRRKYTIVYSNTVVALPLATWLSSKCVNKPKLIAHIHELNYVINETIRDIGKYDRHVSKYIAVSELVKVNLVEKWGLQPSKISIIFPTTDVNDRTVNSANYDKNKPFEVGASGWVNWIKGYDVFIQVARFIKKHHPEKNITFTWVGRADDKHKHRISHDLENANLSEIVNFVGEQLNPHRFFAGFSVFILTSREESFSLVSVEAGLTGKPIICFEKSSGVSELLRKGGGYIVPYLDIEAMAEKIVYYYNHRNAMIKDGEINRDQFSLLRPDKICPQIYRELNDSLKF